MIDNLKTLPPKEKKVAAKVLLEAGYSTRKLQEILGMDDVTIWRASQQATDEELKQFEAEFRMAIEEFRKKGIGVVYKRLLELLPKERRIDQVVRAGEFLEGKQNVTAVQINFKDEAKKELEDYILADEEKNNNDKT